MKRLILCAAVVSMILATATIGVAAEVKNITVASSSMGGTLYLSASRWVEEMKRQIPGINFTSQPGIHAKNMTAIEKGVIQVGFGDTATQAFAYVPTHALSVNRSQELSHQRHCRPP
ncbi:MAG: hypothetical protein H6Q44_1408 [Deltaproteobacteria bacterium]|nr:hypothetical protein [Deltaproteobacteria bacterium]